MIDENEKEQEKENNSSDDKIKNNDIIEILTKGKIELSQIFIAPAIVAFGILQILSGETSPMTWFVLSVSYWLIFILTLFLFLTQYLRIITLLIFMQKKYPDFNKNIDKILITENKVLKKIFNTYYKSSQENLFRLLYIILIIFTLIAFFLWFSVSYKL